MSRYIDADALKEKYTMVTNRYSGGIMERPAVLLEDIDEAPTIEAVSVVRGEWIWHEDEDICNCSECEFEIDATGCIEPMEYVGVFRYCPNCGAKMDGADDEVR